MIKRALLIVFTAAIALSAVADEPDRVVAITGDLTLITPAQRAWLARFESGAVSAVALDAPAAAEWLDRSAADAEGVHLAAYLRTLARVLRGEAAVVDAEKAWRQTADDPLLVIVRLDAAKISEITICTCDPVRRRAVDATIERYERSLRGFVPQWLDTSPTRSITRIANLHFRAGKNASIASTGTYLPFDRALIAQVGRTWIVYDNTMQANWWGEGIRPIALRLLPQSAPKATGAALADWYGHRLPLYQAGPKLTTAQREQLGANRDALSIVKGDLLPVLILGSSDESITTLVAALFYTLRDAEHGDAPPAHKPACSAELAFLIDRGALTFDRATTTWRIDFPRARAAIRDLVAAVMGLERSGSAARVDALFADDGEPRPEVKKSLAAIDGLPNVKVHTLFAGS